MIEKSAEEVETDGWNGGVIMSEVAKIERYPMGQMVDLKEADNGSSYEIPVWHRYILTIVEAAMYYHIGERKIRAIVDEHPNADFVIMNGNRVLIKKEKFEAFLDEATVV